MQSRQPGPPPQRAPPGTRGHGAAPKLFHLPACSALQPGPGAFPAASVRSAVPRARAQRLEGNSPSLNAARGDTGPALPAPAAGRGCRSPHPGLLQNAKSVREGGSTARDAPTSERQTRRSSGGFFAVAPRRPSESCSARGEPRPARSLGCHRVSHNPLSCRAFSDGKNLFNFVVC